MRSLSYFLRKAEVHSTAMCTIYFGSLYFRFPACCSAVKQWGCYNCSSIIDFRPILGWFINVLDTLRLSGTIRSNRLPCGQQFSCPLLVHVSMSVYDHSLQIAMARQLLHRLDISLTPGHNLIAYRYSTE